MSKINDGGPAFPTTERGRTQAGELAQQQVGGMSRRDYFAGQAMQAMIESSVHNETFSDFHSGSAQTYALKAYIMADAMLAAGAATPQG